MEFCISADELRAALAAIEAAEQNGFNHCLAVFKMALAGPMLSDCRATTALLTGGSCQSRKWAEVGDGKATPAE